MICDQCKIDYPKDCILDGTHLCGICALKVLRRSPVLFDYEFAEGSVSQGIYNRAQLFRLELRDANAK